MMAQPMDPMMQQPMMAQQTVIPQSAMQPSYPQQMQPIPQPMYAQQPMMQPMPAYQPNLASVPARPDASLLPSAQQVQQARNELSNDNQMLTGYLRDPRGTQPMPVMQQQPMMAQQQMQQPMPQAMTPALGVPQNITAAYQDKLMGLQPTATGQYALVPLAPEASLGGFSLASSLQYAPGNSQVTMPQYQQLKNVAGQYSQQPGRVRVVSYGNAQDPQALQRATTAAAYLVDMGVPAQSIRVKIDGDAAPTGMAPSKTDIFLETPVQR
jgi:outer membrane protein OmpA-like peptidoglycan-associated protein